MDAIIKCTDKITKNEPFRNQRKLCPQQVRGRAVKQDFQLWMVRTVAINLWCDVFMDCLRHSRILEWRLPLKPQKQSEDSPPQGFGCFLCCALAFADRSWRLWVQSFCPQQYLVNISWFVNPSVFIVQDLFISRIFLEILIVVNILPLGVSSLLHATNHFFITSKMRPRSVPRH